VSALCLVVSYMVITGASFSIGLLTTAHSGIGMAQVLGATCDANLSHRETPSWVAKGAAETEQTGDWVDGLSLGERSEVH